MLEHAFTMTSVEYCGHCGSFDLVKNNPSGIERRLFGAKTIRYCFGCNSRLSDKSFAMNARRTVPLTVDDFFFQTDINNQRLQRYQIQPVTQVLGLSLIVTAIVCLFLFKAPVEVQKLVSNSPQLASNTQQLTSNNSPRLASNSPREWVSANQQPTETYEMRVVKSFQLEFEQLEKAK